MKQTVAAVFGDPAQARQAIEELGTSGFEAEQISTMVSEAHKTKLLVTPDAQAVDGIAAGGFVGAVLGSLTAIGAFLLPGVGVLMASGPLLGVLAGMGAGAATGGIAGGLIGLGLPDEEARLVAKDLEAGRTVVTATTSDPKMIALAQDVFGKFSPDRVFTYDAPAS